MFFDWFRHNHLKANNLVIKMPLKKTVLPCISMACLILQSWGIAYGETPIDLNNYKLDCQVKVEGWNGNLRLSWPINDTETGVLTLDMTGQRPLIQDLAIRKNGGPERENNAQSILSGVDPVWFLTVGERRANDEKAPD